MITSRTKEYLTVGRTPEELQQQEAQLRAAGFKKRYLCHGQSPDTGEFYQWWDRKKLGSYTPEARQTARAARKCVRCGGVVATSQRGQSQWCKKHLDEYREYARNYYHRKLKPLRQKERMQSADSQ